MSFRTDLKPLRGYRFVFATSKPGLFVVRVTAKVLFVPVNAAEFELRTDDVETVNRALDELRHALNVPVQCIQNGSADAARDEVARWADENGFVDLMGSGHFSKPRA